MSDWASAMTGEILYVDNGFSHMATGPRRWRRETEGIVGVRQRLIERHVASVLFWAK